MVAASISKGGAGTPGKLTRANDDSNPYDGWQQIPCRSRPGRGHRTNGCPKNVSRCPKNASQTILQLQTLRLKQETNGRWMPTEFGIQVQEKAAMKRCALCHGKLGLGIRSRNLWNGRWWTHTRFCSARCEGNYELERYNANAKQHRWYTFLYRSSSLG